MNETSETRENRKSKIVAKIGFYRHLTIFLGTNGLLFFIHLKTSGKTSWFLWSLLIWGVIVFVHYLWVHFSPEDIRKTVSTISLESENANQN